VHRAHVMQKLGVNSVAALVQLCGAARPSTPVSAGRQSGSPYHGSKVQWPAANDSAYPADWG